MTDSSFMCSMSMEREWYELTGSFRRTLRVKMTEVRRSFFCRINEFDSSFTAKHEMIKVSPLSSDIQ